MALHDRVSRMALLERFAAAALAGMYADPDTDPRCAPAAAWTIALQMLRWADANAEVIAREVEPPHERSRDPEPTPAAQATRRTAKRR